MNQREIDIAQQQYLIDKCAGKTLQIGCGMKPIPGAINTGPNPERWQYAQVAAGLPIPFADGVFDTVVSSHVLPVFEDIKAALTEMTRVLKVGGRMVHVIPDLRYAPNRKSSHHKFERQYSGWWGPTDFGMAIMDLEDRLFLVSDLENFKAFNWSFKFEAVKL